MADSKHINLDNAIEDDTYVFADKGMIDGVVRNLVSNAIKFTEYKGKILIYSKNDSSQIEVGVKDTGMGMNEETLSDLFNFINTKPSKGTNDEEGSGLGLLLCNEFVEKNGGKIYVESKLYEGSTFKFTLPLQ